MSEAIEERIKPYIAPLGSPKYMTNCPCKICGWNEDAAIHSKTDINGNLLTGRGPYHEYVSRS